MPAELQSLLRIEVPLVVQIASRLMTMEDLMNLAPGAIIELPKKADEELEILVNNKPIAAGAAVKVGENFGVRVTRVGEPRDTVQALGAKPGPDAAPADDPDVEAAA